MKHIVSALLIAALLVSCLTLGIFAEEETTEAASAQEPNRIVFNSELTASDNYRGKSGDRCGCGVEVLLENEVLVILNVSLGICKL